MIVCTVQLGSITAGEMAALVRPKYAPQTPLHPVVYVHGAEGQEPSGLTWMKIASRWPLFRALTDAGHTVLSADLGGAETWGNATLVSRLSTAVAYAKQLPGVDGSKVVLFGQSMGGLGSLVWARQNLGQVHAAVVVIPVVNLTDLYANRGLSTRISAAYGGSYSEAVYGHVHNPATFAANGDLNGLKLQMWYGQQDDLCLPEFAAALGEHVPGCDANAVPGGHAETTVLEMDLGRVVRFIA